MPQKLKKQHNLYSCERRWVRQLLENLLNFPQLLLFIKGKSFQLSFQLNASVVNYIPNTNKSYLPKVQELTVSGK